MRKDDVLSEGEEPLIDTTVAIPKKSKKTGRLQKKLQKKEKARKERAVLSDLPSELILDILYHLRPSDILVLTRVQTSLREFILDQETIISREIIHRRYLALSKCFPLPVPLEKVDKNAHPALQSEERQLLMDIHKRPYQHIKSPDPKLICTCLTCVLAWNQLCLVVDFAHWQRNLNTGEPITPIERGKYPEWNQALIANNSALVQKALYSPLWYARLLETHLRSTVGSIRRHGANKGNKRRRFRMSLEDAAAETDQFLERSGPPSMDFPFHRDNYYMLEAYLPNRGWKASEESWMYMPVFHDRDVEMVKAWAERRKFAAASIESKVS